MNFRIQKAVKELVENGGSIGNAMIKAGYSKNTAKTPQKMTERKAYKEVINPVIEAMERERDRIIVALSKKNLSKEKYRDMIDGLDKLTKNVQLLSGGRTSNESIKITFDNAFTPDDTSR